MCHNPIYFIKLCRSIISRYLLEIIYCGLIYFVRYCMMTRHADFSNMMTGQRFSVDVCAQQSKEV